MDKQIIKSLLNYDFWSHHKLKLVASLFSEEYRELYEVITKAHNKYQKDLTTDELLALWKIDNPLATRAEETVLASIIDSISLTDSMSEEVTSEVVDNLWKREIGRKIGSLGIAITEGREEAFQNLRKLMEDVLEGFKPDDFGLPVTDDVMELLAFTSNDNRWQFNIKSLSDKVYGPGPSDFVIVLARPETGKTAFAVSLAAGPQGWCSQGARVLYLGNEEDVRRTKLRAVMAYTGMTKEQVVKSPIIASTKYNEIANNLIMKEIHGWDTIKVEAYIEEIKPDIVIFDQIDKISIEGNFAATHERLGELYIWGRAIGARYNCAVVGISQASNDAEGKTVITPDMAEGSKTRKFAEGDVILGVGKLPDNADGSVNPARFITVGKNKITGWHGTITCMIEPQISRYVD